MGTAVFYVIATLTLAAATTPVAGEHSRPELRGPLNERQFKAAVANGRFYTDSARWVSFRDGAWRPERPDCSNVPNREWTPRCVDHSYARIDQTAFGDLNGDGFGDAALITIDGGGGSGAFIWLIVALNEGGAATQMVYLPLGDRIDPGKLRIEEGLIRMDGAKMHAPTDGLCCPSLSASYVFRVVDRHLELWRPLAGARWVRVGKAPPDE